MVPFLHEFFSKFQHANSTEDEGHVLGPLLRYNQGYACSCSLLLPPWWPPMVCFYGLYRFNISLHHVIGFPVLKGDKPVPDLNLVVVSAQGQLLAEKITVKLTNMVPTDTMEASDGPSSTNRASARAPFNHHRHYPVESPKMVQHRSFSASNLPTCPGNDTMMVQVVVLVSSCPESSRTPYPNKVLWDESVQRLILARWPQELHHLLLCVNKRLA